jgi:membrane fusion protein (multidrug efflux system)
MFSRIKVDVGVRKDSILVPERAVAELQGKNFIWIIDADNKATQRAVRAGESIDGNLVILEGLKPGERFVVEGLQKVREGMPVQPKTAQNQAHSQHQEKE